MLQELLDKYTEFGAAQFTIPDILQVPPINRHGNIMEIADLFGGPEILRQSVTELQNLLYPHRNKIMAREKKQQTKQPQSTAQQIGSLKNRRATSCARTRAFHRYRRLPHLTWSMFLKFLEDMEQIEESKAAMRGERFAWLWSRRTAGATGRTRRRKTGPELLAFHQPGRGRPAERQTGPDFLHICAAL